MHFILSLKNKKLTIEVNRSEVIYESNIYEKSNSPFSHNRLLALCRPLYD